MSVLIVLMAGNRVVPIDDVEGSVRSDLHIDWTKIAMRRLKDWVFPLEVVRGTVRPDRKPFDSISFVVADHELSVHRFRELRTVQKTNAAVTARLTDIAKFQTM